MIRDFNNQELAIVKYINQYLPFREKHIFSTRELSIKIAEKYGVDFIPKKFCQTTAPYEKILK